MQLWRYGFTVERLGKRYRLIKPLGSGGMADVCLAIDEQSNNNAVAIKVLRPDQLDEELLGRFMKEASLIAGWNHPNIIRIYGDVKWEVLDAKKGSLLPYIVMEYIQGGNLKERLIPDQPYPFRETLRLFTQMCNAVQYAHEHGIIHRDIKPENVLFRQRADGSEDVVLSDFGMAVSLTATHYTFSHGGTPLYMAPEQLRGQVQPASDIYALGVLLYQLCTGQLPFQSQFAQITNPLQPPPHPSSINTALPIALDEIILTALASNPTQRFSSAQIFKERLQNVAASISLRSPNSKENGPLASSSASIKVVQPLPSSLETKEADAADKSKDVNKSLLATNNATPAQANQGKEVLENKPLNGTGAQERRWPFLGRKSKSLNGGAAIAGGAIAGAAAAPSNAEQQGAPKTVGQQTSASTPPSNGVESGDQSVAQIPLRHGSSAQPVPAASTSTIDDDDAIDDTSAASAMSPVSQASPPATPTTNVSEPPGGEADPGIIDLRPRARNGGRNTVDLRGSTAAAGTIPAAQPAQPVESPISRGAARRRNGGAAASGGLVLGAAAASAALAGAPTAASGGANASSPVAGGARPAGIGQAPQRVIPPGRVRRGNPSPRRGRVVLLLLLLVASAVVCASVNSGGFPSVIIRPILNLLPPVLHSTSTTITITPDSKEVQDSYVMQAVTTQPNIDQLQVSIRSLNVAPDAQNRTVAGTGRGQIAAVAAKGRLTFTNGAFSPYTVASGTVISASNGVSVVTDQSVTIPASVPGGATGSNSVSAHAVTSGTAGNLDQGSINKQCCSTVGNIIVKNDAAFTGGVDAQTYPFVRQGDVNVVATPLENTASQQASTLFKQQLKPNEKLVDDPTCNSNVQVPAGTVGDQGHAIASTTITVTARCMGVAYDRGAVQAIAKDRLQKKATIDPGQGYALVGNIVPDVTVSKVNADSISLLVNARGIWAYQFDSAKQQALAKQLAGKKMTDAQAFLNAQRGITNVKIGLNGNVLPTDPAHITFNIQRVPGENVSGNQDNNSKPNGAPSPGKG